jgi:hypothetical protein
VEEGAVTEVGKAAAARPTLDSAQSPLQTELEKLLEAANRGIQFLPYWGLFAMGGPILSGVVGLIRSLNRNDVFIDAHLIQLAVCLSIAVLVFILTISRQRILSRHRAERLDKVRQILIDGGLFALALRDMEGLNREKPAAGLTGHLKLLNLPDRPDQSAKGIATKLQKEGLKLLRWKFQVQSFDEISSPLMEAELRLALAQVINEELGEIRPLER